MVSVDYESSICFSSKIPEELNKQAFLMDKRLFLFAYYEPKGYIPGESFQSKFKTAIINLYGLFKDCSPFLKNIQYGQNSILIVNYKRYMEDFDCLFRLICSFRSILCHNNSDVFPLNAAHYIYVNKWLVSRCAIYKELSDLDDNDWEKMLMTLYSQTDLYICGLKMNIKELISKQEAGENINSVILHWINSIVQSYVNNKDYLLNAMVSLYQLYLCNARICSNPEIPTRTKTKKWLVKHCGALSQDKWYDKWLPYKSSEEDLGSSKIGRVIIDWPDYWATYYGRSAAECNEAPLPGGIFFRIVASDVDNYASNPQVGYNI